MSPLTDYKRLTWVISVCVCVLVFNMQSCLQSKIVSLSEDVQTWNENKHKIIAKFECLVFAYMKNNISTLERVWDHALFTFQYNDNKIGHTNKKQI